MRRPAVLILAASAVLLVLPAASASGLVTPYHDRATFEAALAGLGQIRTDDYESYPLGDIVLGDVRGDFLYTFDPTITQSAVVPSGNGGQALGGSPFDVLVGGDSITLTYQPVSPQAPVLLAFGADILYAPSFDTIPADTYRIEIADGTATGQFAGNLDSIDPNGGSFFLGLIADPNAVFTEVMLFSVQSDPAFLVPAYQADDLIYSAVPEPTTLALSALGGVVLVARSRRRK